LVSPIEFYTESNRLILLLEQLFHSIMLRVNSPFTNYILYIILVKNNLEYFTLYEVHVIYALDLYFSKK